MPKRKTRIIPSRKWSKLAAYWPMLLAFIALGYIIYRSFAAVQLKPQISGLLDRSASPKSPYSGIISGYVVAANWSDLQPTQGSDIAPNNIVDQQILSARKQGLKLKIRFYAGVNAPDWAKQLGGPPIQLCDTIGDPPKCGTVGRFWTKEFGNAYNDWQGKLAAKYDNMPEIAEVTISRCTTIYAEPFIRKLEYQPNAQAYKNAGYTVDADKQCQKDQITAHKVWSHTRSSLALNPYEGLDILGYAKTDEKFTEEMIDYCRQVLTNRCVLGNNSLRAEDLSDEYTSMYAKIHEAGAPIYFQTAALARVGDLYQTLQKALDYGSGMVELPAGYAKDTSNEALGRYKTYDQQLEKQAAPAESSIPPKSQVFFNF